MKIRTPSAAQSAQLEALGATPIDMPVTQIYNNLDRGVIDATMIPMSAALDFKLIEVAKYFTIDAPLGRSPFLVAMNKARYDKLPADLRKVIDDTTGLQLSLKGAATYDKKNNEALEAAKKSPRGHRAGGAGARALGRRVQADDRPQGRGGREGRPAGARAGRRLRAAQLTPGKRRTFSQRQGANLEGLGTTEAPIGTLRPLSARAGARRRLGADAADGLHGPRRRAALRLQSAVQRLARAHRVRDVGDRLPRHRLLRLDRRACRRRYPRASARGPAAALRSGAADAGQRGAVLRHRVARPRSRRSPRCTASAT